MARWCGSTSRAWGAARYAVVLSAALAVGGCATGYQDIHHSIPLLGAFGAGGYWDEPGPGELIKVGFVGNGHTDNTAVVTYLTWRCTELAVQRHKPFMRIYPSLVSAVLNQPSTDINVANIMGGPADWVFVLFDDKYVPGDLDVAQIRAQLLPRMKAEGAAP